MIGYKEKKEIIEVLGVRYSKGIQAFLILNKIFTKKGTVHSTSMIRSVMNGERSHEEIEVAIFEYAAQKKTEHKALRKRLKTA
jgi:hypothetical protein